MKYLLLISLLPLLSASDCGKKNSFPACIKKIIDDGSKETPPNLPEQVDEYRYQDKTVYLVTAPCCDHFNVVYDENCNQVCAASGGITGKGDGKCEDFASTAKLIKTIWKKPAP